MGWPLPGNDTPNQFVVQIIGAGASFEFAFFWNHAIITGCYDVDIGFLLAAPSMENARFSGNPRLYYSKYAWSELGDTFFLESAQSYWSDRKILLRFLALPCSQRLMSLPPSYSKQLAGVNVTGNYPPLVLLQDQ